MSNRCAGGQRVDGPRSSGEDSRALWDKRRTISMSKKEFARVACFVALLYGAIQLSRDREAGPLTTGFRLLLVAGGTVGLVWLGFPGKGGEESEQTSAGAAPAAAAPIV